MSQTPLTFLFTDLEGSSRLWEQFPEEMRPALERHDALLQAAVEKHHGRVIKTTGDGLHAVFKSPAGGIAAALAGQLAIGAEKWPEATGPLKVRMGLHTGTSSARGGDFYGPAVNRAARMMSAGHGGQVLLSAATCALVQDALPEESSLQDLGQHRLRDLDKPEQIYQLCHPALGSEFPPLNTLSASRHNLPVQLTSFIGRERELAQIKQLLIDPGQPGAGTRMLTLLGPGGTGKTRLALQAAAELAGHFPDGIWLVELAPLTDPDLIAERVAEIFNLQEQRGRPILTTLTEHLRRRDLLLLLDNVEHLVRESAEFAEHLLENCPDIRLLVTGREALFIAGETTLQIPSLSLPRKARWSIDDPVTLDETSGAEAVQLFLARAAAVRPEFTLTEDNAGSVAEIVRRLDGIPLALELAAARLRMMSVRQIAERLNDRFRLLTGGRRTALERQQTLQALIDWSWNLLEGHEHVLLRRLSVFSGGFSLEAVQEITGIDPLDPLDILDLLEQLINKSLVYVEYLPDGGVRYHLLESIRQYARDRLFEAEEGTALRNRHAEHFTTFAEVMGKRLEGPEMLDWLPLFLGEIDNTRAAREWALDSRPDLMVRLVSLNLLVQRYWYFSPDGRRWLEEVEEKVRTQADGSHDPETRRGLAAAITAYGAAVFGSGESFRASRIVQEGVALAREVNDIETLAFGLNMQLIANLQLGEFDEAERLAQEALAITEAHDLPLLRMMTMGSYTPIFSFKGDHLHAASFTADAVELANALNNPWTTAMSRHLTGWLERGKNHLPEAAAAFSEAAELFDVVRDTVFKYISLSEAGHLKRLMGDFAGAEEIYHQTIRFFQEGSGKSALIHQLESFGIAAAFQDHDARAARLLGAAKRYREVEESVRLPHEEDEFDQALAHLADVMGAAARDEAMAEGARMTIDEAVEFAVGV